MANKLMPLSWGTETTLQPIQRKPMPVLRLSLAPVIVASLLGMACAGATAPLPLGAAIMGTWSGIRIVPDSTGANFTTVGGQWISFGSSGTYSSNIPPPNDSVTGSYAVVDNSVIITVPPITGNPYAMHLEDVAQTGDSLTFVIDWNSVSNGYQLIRAAIFRLRRQQ